MESRYRGRLQVLGAGVCWSLAGPGIKLAALLDGWQIAGIRSLFGFLFLSALLRPWRAPALLARPRVLLLACCYAGMVTLFVLANTLTTAANAVFLQYTAPVWVMLLAPWVLRERSGWREGIVLVCCLAGVWLFFLDELSWSESRGNLLAVLAGVGYAIVFLGLRAGRRKQGELPPPAEDVKAPSSALPTETSRAAGPVQTPMGEAEAIVVWGNLLCFLFCLGWMGPWPEAREAAVPFAVAAGMGVFQLGLGYHLLIKGIGQVSVVEASLLALLEPVLNPLWTFLLKGEKPGRWAMVGSVIILTALVWLAFQDKAGKQERA